MSHFDSTEVGDSVRTSTALTPMTGKGKELCDLLRKELGVPAGVVNFEVRFARDDVIRVSCDYIPGAA